ncbi:50S ribosomal protein L9 [Chondrinema litorale]|uniref:50S ribosomal protein L9 n=1 Tax=Chondrinema litorale TaxID=2994555 RepID=UPI002544591A|nr:50S ribosomal protein L9 [Chondrinema litorale]UZR93775.1 50S ribosomal protein L9 [Chondrinema litorale]
MEIILKDDIKGLGYKDDVVTVKPGYGRNYLIPQGLAILATESNKKVLAENLKQASHKAEKVKTEAEAIANSIGDLELSIGAKAGESGKIFGAVTALQIADSLKAKGFDIDRRKISFSSDIKMLGEYTVLLDLHKEVKKEITIKVVEE